MLVALILDCSHLFILAALFFIMPDVTFGALCHFVVVRNNFYIQHLLGLVGWVGSKTLTYQPSPTRPTRQPNSLCIKVILTKANPTTVANINNRSMFKQNKNSSGDEIANVNF